MTIQIHHISNGRFGRHVTFSADGARHTANLQNSGENYLWAFAKPTATEPDVTPTRQIHNPAMLAALVAAVNTL